ncbi:MAG: helix-turn-helix transcriptional regulator [Pedobacter sp.]|uniref:helix-turn-helix domain-containing protein n=1 Tax=Pedobacter sp. TaxID=1411316 RepID=UPI00339B9B90
MEENTDLNKKEGFSNRINHIMNTIGLEIAGFAELTGISESHIYALSNGTKGLTTEIAEKIAVPLKIRKTQILNPAYLISDSIRNAPAVKKFHNTFKKGNPEYFTETKAARKSSYFIEQELLPTDLFKEEVYGWQVRDACAERGINLSSKQVSQNLNYLVETKKLRSEKRKLKKKNGEMADREVYVYFRDQNDQ